MMDEHPKIYNRMGIGISAVLPAYSRLMNLSEGFPDSLKYEDVVGLTVGFDGVTDHIKRSIEDLCTVAGCSNADLRFIRMDSTITATACNIVWMMSDAIRYMRVYDSDNNNGVYRPKARIRTFYNCFISAGTLLVTHLPSLNLRYIIIRIR